MAGKQESNLAAIKMLVMDVDGVFTDGTIIIGDDGTESKRFSYLDGHGIKLWHRAGMKSAVISGKDSPATAIRAEHVEAGLPGGEVHRHEQRLPSGVRAGRVGDDPRLPRIVQRAHDLDLVGGGSSNRHLAV